MLIAMGSAANDELTVQGAPVTWRGLWNQEPTL
jgi:hypothetical protein